MPVVDVYFFLCVCASHANSSSGGFPDKIKTGNSKNKKNKKEKKGTKSY